MEDAYNKQQYLQIWRTGRVFLRNTARKFGQGFAGKKPALSFEFLVLFKGLSTLL